MQPGFQRNDQVGDLFQYFCGWVGVLGIQNSKLFKSPFALKICVFRESPHHHPVLYLRGVKKTDIAALLDFMYHGEARF